MHCFDDEIGIRDDHFNFLDESALVRGLYHNLLVRACKIRRFLDAEILVDAFDYRCTLRGRIVSIVPPSPDLEMSIRLGYVQSEQADQRTRIARILAMREGRLSIFKAADLFYDRFRDRIVQIREWPARRYVFLFPDTPDFRAFFSHDGLLVEEQIYLQGILDAELATWDEIKRFEVRKDVSVFDLLKMYRLFTFVRDVATRHLKVLLEQDPGLGYRSLVPVFRMDELQTLPGWCLPKDTIDTVIDMLSWKRGAEGVVDLQYKPILQGARYYLAPLNITGTINWYRNLAYTQKRRVINVAEEEAASRALSAALGRVSGYVRKGFTTTLGGKDIEIDVVSRFGEYLFVFECKHALHPCNVHELRTSYEHMKKAALTLTRIVDLLSRKDIEAEFYRRLGWDVAPATDIVTCIVSCNGMFPGLSISGHPIRRWTELKNMIESGTVRIGSMQVVEDDGGLGIQPDGLVERNVWGGPELTPRFLREYVRGVWLRTMLFGAMVSWERRYYLKTWELAFPTYAFDLVAAKKSIENLP